MSMHKNKPFKGAGTILIRERKSGENFDEFGNCSALTFAINETTSKQKDYRTIQGGTAASLSQVDDITGSITGLSYQPSVLQIALRGLVELVPATPIVDEAIKLSAGKHIKLAHIPDQTQTITITDTVGTTDLTLGTDFIIVAGMVKITGYVPATDGTAATISYTPIEYYKTKALGSTTLEYEVVFNGYNLAYNDEPVEMIIHRVKFSAAQALDMLNDDFAELPIEFEVLADDQATDPNNQFFEMRMVK